MANRTVKDAHTVKGTNPQYLIEKIIRTRIYDSRYWKEECFALTAELLVDKAMELRYIGGTFAGNIKPAPFLCLVLKMLQIQPEKDIIIEFIKNEDFKYVRALGAYYLRLTGTSLECYKYLEPLLNDYRKIRFQTREGKFELSHMDEFIDQLLRDERSCDVILPRIQKRHVLEENGDIEPKKSILEDDLDNEDEDDEEEEEGEERSPAPPPTSTSSHKHRRDEPREERSRRERSRSHDRSTRRRSSSRDRTRRRGHDHRGDDRGGDRRERRRSRSRSRERRDRDRDRGDRKSGTSGQSRSAGGGGSGKDSMSVEETNKLRASLGLAPLK